MTLYCSFCGNPIEENTTYCPNCGAYTEESNQNSSKNSSSQYQSVTDIPSSSLPQQPVVTYQPVQTTYQAPPPVQDNSAANNALVLSLVGLFCFPVIPSIFGLIAGIRALNNPYNRGIAIVAIVLSVFGILPVFALLFLFWW